MQGIAVTLLTEDKERLAGLQHLLDSTQMGRNVFSHIGFPASPTDPVLRQIQDVRAEVVLVDIDPQNGQRAVSAIELIQSNTSRSEEHTSELQSLAYLVCRLLLEKKKKRTLSINNLHNNIILIKH